VPGPLARAAVALTGALLVPVLGSLGAQAATATPTPPSLPSARQVQQAQAAASAKAAKVKAVEAALVAASARLDDARVTAEQAAEAYNAARIRLAAADRAAQLSRSTAAGATATYDRARADVGRLASQVYRNGGDLSEISAFLGQGGPQDVLDRAAMIDNLGAKRARAMQRLDATRVVAYLLQQQADDALRRQRAATAALVTVRDQAESATDAAAATVAAAEAEQAKLLVELAELRHTSAALEQQRQVALAARAAAGQHQGGSGGSDSGSGSAGSGGAGSGGAGSGGAGSGGAGSGGAGSGSAGSGGAGSGGAGSGGAGSGGAGSDGSGSDGSGSDGSGSGVPVPTGSPHGSSSAGTEAVAWAKQQLGLPYRWGGAGPDSYDCSGLTMRAWQHAGVALPHYAASQYAQSAKVPYSGIRPGDLIFYATDPGRPSSIHHVTMYIGGGRMIEAPYTGANVRIVAVRWSRTMPWAGRP
jgi:cell wall-associated NlpC family hydrolase